MAIKLTYVRKNGKLVKNMDVIDIAREIEEILKERGITCDVSISKFYSDRWYSADVLEKLLQKRQDDI